MYIINMYCMPVYCRPLLRKASINDDYGIAVKVCYVPVVLILAYVTIDMHAEIRTVVASQ